MFLTSSFSFATSSFTFSLSSVVVVVLCTSPLLCVRQVCVAWWDYLSLGCQHGYDRRRRHIISLESVDWGGWNHRVSGSGHHHRVVNSCHDHRIDKSVDLSVDLRRF